MKPIFFRRRASAPTQSAPPKAEGLGEQLMALRLEAGDVAPPESTLVVFHGAGHARRLSAGKVVCEPGELALCFHTGPYTIHVAPFVASPEWGLRMRFVVDIDTTRVVQQRFEVYLYSEMVERLSLQTFSDAVQAALQTALAQGALELPPCTSLEEWQLFRAGLNQLLYTRFGITLDDCVPVDLGDQVDYAATLRQRAAVLVASPSPPASALSTCENECYAEAEVYSAVQDAYGLRRLLIELPGLSSALRRVDLPPGLAVFQQVQALLQRLVMAVLQVNTMPALAWAAPDQPLSDAQQARRARHTGFAVQALDEGWALLAQLQLASHPQWPALLDQAERICANLEAGLACRRATAAVANNASTSTSTSTRMEPSL